MVVCECMCFQNENGDSVCIRCRGDIYSCECPLRHNPNCEKKDDSQEKAKVIQTNRLVQVLGLSRTHKVVRREDE